MSFNQSGKLLPRCQGYGMGKGKGFNNSFSQDQVKGFVLDFFENECQ